MVNIKVGRIPIQMWLSFEPSTWAGGGTENTAGYARGRRAGHFRLRIRPRAGPRLSYAISFRVGYFRLRIRPRAGPRLSY